MRCVRVLALELGVSMQGTQLSSSSFLAQNRALGEQGQAKLRERDAIQADQARVFEAADAIVEGGEPQMSAVWAGGIKVATLRDRHGRTLLQVTRCLGLPLLALTLGACSLGAACLLLLPGRLLGAPLPACRALLSL